MLKRHRAWLVARGDWDDAKEEEFLAGCGKLITEAIAAVEGAPPPAISTLFEGVYARLPPHLADQRARLERKEPVGRNKTVGPKTDGSDGEGPR